LEGVYSRKPYIEEEGLGKCKGASR